MKSLTNLLTSVFLFIGYLCFGQSNQNGQTIFHLYGGTDSYLNSLKGKYDNVHDGDRHFRLDETSSSGSWGMRVEHILSKRFGVGLDFWYAHSSAIAICSRKVYNTGVASRDSLRATVSEDLSRLNTTLRFDIHFGRSPFFDPYIHGALGASLYKYVTTTTNEEVYAESSFYFPISMKIGSGAKFWIRPQFCGYVEINIGGPILSAGICYKIIPKTRIY